jgi:hypothetical protein
MHEVVGTHQHKFFAWWGTILVAMLTGWAPSTGGTRLFPCRISSIIKTILNSVDMKGHFDDRTIFI